MSASVPSLSRPDSSSSATDRGSESATYEGIAAPASEILLQYALSLQHGDSVIKLDSRHASYMTSDNVQHSAKNKIDISSFFELQIF